MTASVADITIEQGTTFSLAVAADVRHNASWALRGTIKRRYDGLQLATLTPSAVASDGSGTMSMTAAETALLFAPPWTRDDDSRILLGYYDVEAYLGAVVHRVAQGKVYLNREITT